MKGGVGVVGWKLLNCEIIYRNHAFRNSAQFLVPRALHGVPSLMLSQEAIPESNIH